METDYRLRSTGDQPISSFEARLAGRRLFHLMESQALWDGTDLPLQTVSAVPRNTLLVLPQSWRVGERHTLRVNSEIVNPAADETGLRFSADAFFLPSEGWAPELLPPPGLFPEGGIPPARWLLEVTVPDGFLVHMSGRPKKTSRHGSETQIQAIQSPQDRYPFVVAGRYKQVVAESEGEKVLLWTRAGEEPANMRAAADALVQTSRAYTATFGPPARKTQQLWIVECPALPGCFSVTASSYAEFLGASLGQVTSELASADTLMMDVGGGPVKVAAAAPALAASWLGYGQNPAFYEQQPPLSALPAFASALGQVAIEGPASRAETIRRALQQIPAKSAPRQMESASAIRAKSFLFFFALQDRYGQDAFRHAINHMLTARRGRGFDLADLIAAFEEETHQNVAEFERLWMKHPGVPQEFRSRYENASASNLFPIKETVP